MPTNYTQQEHGNPIWLDELGIILSLPRFSNESYSDYRERLTLQTRSPPDPAEQGLIRSINRVVGLTEEDIFTLNLVLDSNDVPVAPDPFIKIDGVFLRIWSDYENNVLDLELDIYNKDGAYFLKDVYSSLISLPFLTVDIETRKDLSDWGYMRSWNLVYGDSHRFFDIGNLAPSRMNDLPHNNIKNMNFFNEIMFQTEVASIDLIQKEGQYHVDYINGIIFTFDMAFGEVTYVYREFPYTLVWQPVKIVPLNAGSIEHLTKDYLVNPDGQNERLLLNSYGAQIANETLAIHPLQWGK